MPDLPSGTVTFLFTDIEGSTRLWEKHPEAMRLALARHDALMRSAITQHDGHIFKTMGDAFCAAFHTAPNALQAALVAQQRLTSEPWPDGVTITVRMALHTGAAERRDHDYFGQPLNRVARLLAAGHGGQILLSLTTQELTRDTLPPKGTLADLSVHRLRDLNRPENIFQLLYPDLPAEFPPLKSLDNPALPNNLPLQLTSFIGREKEAEQVKDLLQKSRLLTLTGSGGSGKTRLSLQVAADVLEQYPDGVWYIELAPLTDPVLVLQTVASTLRLTEQTEKPLLQSLTDRLKSKRLLLILDNCEHLLAACAQFTDNLLRSCPYVTILSSSRESLGIAGEHTYRVPSLSLPDLRPPHSLEQINQYEAVRLFIDRAQLHKPDFTVTNANATSLTSICHRLDGIPLAIELAAARIRSLSAEEINSKLDNRFRLLTGGSKTALPRQQTLRALIDWSYGLLNGQEKLLLLRLSVFSGGWTLEAAEQVCTGESADGERIEDWEALDLLTSLVDKSLALAEQQGQATRYRLLETVRQYALEHLVESGDVLSVRRRHRDYFLSLAEEGKLQLQSANQASLISRLETEHDNLRHAISFCLEDPDSGEAGLRFGAAMWLFWWMRLHLSEGYRFLTALLGLSVRQELRMERAEALNGAGLLAWTRGDYAVARPLHEESLAISQDLGNRSGIAWSLLHLGAISSNEGDQELGHALTAECLAIFREIGETWGVGLALYNLGCYTLSLSDHKMARAHLEESLTVCRKLGHLTWQAANLNMLGSLASLEEDFLSARKLKEEALAIMREVGDTWGISATLNSLADVLLQQREYTLARTLYEENLTIVRQKGDSRHTAATLICLGYVAVYEGDHDASLAFLENSLALCRESGYRPGIAVGLNRLGDLAIIQGDYAWAGALLEECLRITHELEDHQVIIDALDTSAFLAYQCRQPIRAARLLGVADTLRNSLGYFRPPLEKERYVQMTIKMRETLDEAAVNVAYEEGHAMTLEDAIVYALKRSE